MEKTVELGVAREGRRACADTLSEPTAHTAAQALVLPHTKVYGAAVSWTAAHTVRFVVPRTGAGWR